MDVYQTEEQQVDAIKSYWKENGNTIIAGIVIGLGSFIGYNKYQDYNAEQEVKVAESFQAVMESAGTDEQAFTSAANQFISENSDSSYASLTALALAKQAATSQDWAEVEKQLTVAVSKATDSGIKAIATMRLARVQVQQEQYDNALATLSAQLPASFTAAAEEIKGDVYFKQGKNDLARNAYQAAIDANGVAANPSLQMKLDDLAVAVNLPK
ncbi:YfgM family protein [Thalassotalea sp. PLHSN55]|uniref:YfgM family protein n=1 Tax=Thalassotalea sp. PLHSN55 TaxID=3435888 RepID=UPI003F875E94